MKTVQLTLNVDSEKLEAIKLYLSKKDVDISTELESTFEKIYEKTVPPAVREFLAERFDNQPKPTAKQPPKPATKPQPKPAPMQPQQMPEPSKTDE